MIKKGDHIEQLLREERLFVRDQQTKTLQLDLSALFHSLITFSLYSGSFSFSSPKTLSLDRLCTLRKDFTGAGRPFHTT
jgi:hypothetical protein